MSVDAEPVPATGTRASSRGLDPDQLAALEEQRDFLLGSLADLDREHDAGDLDDHDFVELRDDYTARAAEVIRAIEDHRDARRLRPSAPFAPSAPWPSSVASRSSRCWPAVVVASSVGARKPGGTSSGGITVAETTSQRAQQCIPKINTEPAATSIACFRKILDEDPENAVALTWLAWDISLAAGQAPLGHHRTRGASHRRRDRAAGQLGAPA